MKKNLFAFLLVVAITVHAGDVLRNPKVPFAFPGFKGSTMISFIGATQGQVLDTKYGGDIQIIHVGLEGNFRGEGLAFIPYEGKPLTNSQTVLVYLFSQKTSGGTSTNFVILHP